MTYSLPSSATPELLLGTHLSVVVRARAEFDDGSCSSDLGLVIPRQHCTGDLPSEKALRVAGRRCLRRLNTDRSQPARRVLVCVEGRWLPLVSSREPIMPPRQLCQGVTMSPYFLSAKHMLAGVGFAALAGSASLAAAGTPDENYRKERANCMSGHTAEDRTTCLREAGAALVEAKRGNLTTEPPEVLAANALQRCKVQPPQDRADCERLVRGEGSQAGSVAQGAVIRQIATVQIDPPAAGASAAASAATR